MKARAEDVRAMKARLNGRQASRREQLLHWDEDMAAGVRNHSRVDIDGMQLVSQDGKLWLVPKAEIPRMLRRGKRAEAGMVARMAAGAVARNWLFLLVLGMATLAAAAAL